MDTARTLRQRTTSTTKDHDCKATKAIPTARDVSDRGIFSFFWLPPEIRDMIYELLVVRNKPVPVVTSLKAVLSSEIQEPHLKLRKEPSLAKTGRQIRHEILPMYYSKNTFVFYLDDMDLRPFYKWVAMVGRNSTRLIRHLELHFIDTTSGSSLRPDGVEYLELCESAFDLDTINIGIRGYSEYVDLFRQLCDVTQAVRDMGQSWSEITNFMEEVRWLMQYYNSAEGHARDVDSPYAVCGRYRPDLDDQGDCKSDFLYK